MVLAWLWAWVSCRYVDLMSFGGVFVGHDGGGTKYPQRGIRTRWVFTRVLGGQTAKDHLPAWVGVLVSLALSILAPFIGYRNQPFATKNGFGCKRLVSSMILFHYINCCDSGGFTGCGMVLPLVFCCNLWAVPQVGRTGSVFWHMPLLGKCGVLFG